MLPENAHAHHYNDFLSETGHMIQLGNCDQGALGTLPPCRFTISKRGQRGPTGEFKGFL